MKLHRVLVVFALAAAVIAPAPLSADRTVDKAPVSIASILKPGLPLELVSAKKADRIAWVSYEEGRRNVFTAAGPAFKVVRVTSFLKDDGIDLTQVRVSDDGSTIAFVRGHAANNTGWVANPNGDPNGADRTIWAARTAVP
jgi:dipeptidyl-peptidase-4